ncbi:hypothetical protein C4K68_08395 [Pokkaliibacter plantistimulans]|uniref:Lipoprotein n=1 Tax=Proteobacteria bacterium 228 TaxID=2083153 RepID=A0A2S5KU60_9PROT|nr:hypothetical protein [Pokkaliibacter plantistimulans]PPC77796.1 hypothetical protein C4K68_08395 [Pokkaliibacter plantistimulans]
MRIRHSLPSLLLLTILGGCSSLPWHDRDSTLVMRKVEEDGTFRLQQIDVQPPRLIAERKVPKGDYLSLQQQGNSWLAQAGNWQRRLPAGQYAWYRLPAEPSTTNTDAQGPSRQDMTDLGVNILRALLN